MLKTESSKLELNNKINEILFELEKLFPDARCELNYKNIYELCVAVMLSAQTTDKKVNNITPTLFSKYPSVKELKNALQQDVELIIRPLGLSNNKSKNIIAFAKIIDEKYNGTIPNDFETLVTLPGIGRKTANVVLSEGFGIMRIAVDTHVERVSKRLGLAPKNSDVLKVERCLQRKFKKELWSKRHLQLVLFGRYHCKAVKPECINCKLQDLCKEKRKNI